MIAERMPISLHLGREHALQALQKAFEDSNQAREGEDVFTRMR